MVLTAVDFCKKYKIGGAFICANTFRQRLERGIFPPRTQCHKTPVGWMVYFNEVDFKLNT
jgi:hypothetical protein